MNCDSTFYIAKVLSLLLCLLLVTACAQRIGLRNPAYAPIEPVVTSINIKNNGSIYQEGMRVAFFDDMRAKHVGDILTVLLLENTSASKSAKTNASKNQNVDQQPPKVAGSRVTRDGKDILSNQVDANRKFSAGGSTSQRNSLNGTITVTVAKVLPNNNLIVRGEKIIMLNQGNEYIRFMGIVRPMDIRPDNTVDSTRIAHVQISYGGQGVINDANRMGWLARFFQGGAWPF